LTELSAAFAPWSLRVDGKVSKKPVVAGDLIYVTTTAGTVHAVRAATGEHVWARRLPDPAASAPVVAQENVLVNVGERDRYGRGAAVVAFDAATGEPRWDDPYGGFWGEAAVDDEGRVLVDTGRSTLRAFDAATGVTAWTADLSELERDRAPDGRHIFSIEKPVSPVGGRVFVHLSISVCYCLDGRDGSVVWRTAYGSYYDAWSAAAVHDGVVYLGTGDGGLVALDSATGAIRYEGRPPWEHLHGSVGWPDPAERSPVIAGRPVVAGESIWFGAGNGYLCAYHTHDRSLQLVGNLPARWGAPQPVPAGDRVLAFWPSGHIGAYDVIDGERMWTGRVRRRSTGPAATGEMFCYGRGRTLLTHDTGTGQAPTRRVLRQRHR
jgi:outer membrane protein assembly factor BamB